jgi:hydrogenase expression/formation protein HypE
MSNPTETVSTAGERIVLAHGGGGQLTQQLLAERVLPRLTNGLLAPLTDSAVLPPCERLMVFTTDAVMGAEPIALSLALIVEEGLPLEVFDRIIASIASTAQEAGVPIATGDTKVIERRGGDGMMITTAGIGAVRSGVELAASRIRPGDAIIINGGIAEHGLTIMSVREGIAFDTDLRSDAAPLNGLIAHVLDSAADVKFMRDPTRGGLAGVLCDAAESAGVGVHVEEGRLPISSIVRHTSELLGLDPLTVANEGKCVMVVAEADAEGVLATCRSHPLGVGAARIGTMVESDLPLVELHTAIGGARIVQRPYGEELPRIC